MKLLATLAMSLACTAGGGVNAQVPDKEITLGSRIPQRIDWHDSPQSKVRPIQHRFGACVVKKRPELAARYVLEPYDKRSTKPLLHNLESDLSNCLGTASAATDMVKMSFPGAMLKYALADALVQSELSRAAPLTNLALVARLGHGSIDPQDFLPPAGKTLKPAQLKQLEQDKIKAQASIYLSQYGECVLREDPASSHALLVAQPESAQETAAFGRLGPALAICLDRGHTLALNKMSLRGTLALNYYRLAKAPRVPAPNPGIAQ